MNLCYKDAVNKSEFKGTVTMTSLKLFLLIGLALLMAGVIQLGSKIGESCAWGGLIALALGLMQPYVFLPARMKLVSGLLYLAGIITVATQIGVAIKVGGSIGLLVFASHFWGVLRFSGRSQAD